MPLREPEILRDLKERERDFLGDPRAKFHLIRNDERPPPQTSLGQAMRALGGIEAAVFSGFARVSGRGWVSANSLPHRVRE